MHTRETGFLIPDRGLPHPWADVAGREMMEEGALLMVVRTIIQRAAAITTIVEENGETGHYTELVISPLLRSMSEDLSAVEVLLNAWHKAWVATHRQDQEGGVV